MGTDIGAFILVDKEYEVWPIEDSGEWVRSGLSKQTKGHFKL